MMEVNLFLPQMRLSFDQLVARARTAEASGFAGIRSRIASKASCTCCAARFKLFAVAASWSHSG